MKLWDAATGQLLRTFTHADFVKSIAFSPDGTRALSGDVTNKVDLWDLSTGRLLQSFLGHTGAIYYGVAFSPDGSRALSSSYDKTVKLWDVATGRVLRTFQRDVRSVAFSPDGTRALLDSEIWDLDYRRAAPHDYRVAAQRVARHHTGRLFCRLRERRGHPQYRARVRCGSIDQFYQSLYRPDSCARSLRAIRAGWCARRRRGSISQGAGKRQCADGEARLAARGHARQWRAGHGRGGDR